jgi:hypothetical protein
MPNLMTRLRRMIGLETHPGIENRSSAAPRLFIHIPKTAGTSFRSAAEARFGSNRVLRDYGPESEDTSRSVKEHVYELDQPGAISQALVQQEAVLLSGHFPLTKYRDVFRLRDTATLVRNPVDQVVSHFQHQSRHYRYGGTLMDFARQSQYQNVQSHYVGMLDPSMIGLVGLTESYRAFLRILNSQWGWNLPHRRRNIGNRFGLGRIRLTLGERREIERLNAVDATLYRRAAAVFQNRMKAFESGCDCDVRGGLSYSAANSVISGWAWDLERPGPVTVEIFLDGDHLTSVTCDQSVNGLSGWKLPNEGRVGFNLEQGTLTENSVLEMRDPTLELILDRQRITAPSDG